MRISIALGLMAIAGCSATGTPFKDHPAHKEPVPAHTSRIIVYRLDRAQNSTAVAKLKMDNAPVGDLREDGFLARDVAPGAHTLNVDLPLEPGTCDLRVEIADGETDYFLVAPRVANAVAKTPGTIAQVFTDIFVPGVAPFLLGEAAIQAGAALESASRKCGGPFSMVRVVPTAAEAMLLELRESK
ncbi:MAG: hypothetical protein ABI616_03660 [Pseudomonadota bacterium]